MNLEYKVVQSNTPMFANPERLKAVMAEEARAGWDLVEKLDNYKLRFARDISHRAQDDARGFDAYRTQVGVSSVITYTITAMVTVAIVLVILSASGLFG